MMIYLAVTIFRMHLDAAKVSQFYEICGTQISIVKLNMNLELDVIYGYAVMYFS